MKRAYIITCLGLVVAVSVGGFIAWEVGEPARTRQRGRTLAEQHWKDGWAITWVTDDSPYSYSKDGVYFEHNYDRTNGLLVRKYKSFDESRRAFAEGYNSAIAQLIQDNGIPPWSARNCLVADAELVALLESPDIQRVSTFPYDVTDSIVIVNGGSFSRWGYATSGGGIRIEARRGGSFGGGNFDGPIYVGNSSRHPQIVFIRIGKQCVRAFHKDGRFISCAWR